MPLNPYELAQKIYGPSYISFESALSFHGLIPEAVYTVTSACLSRSREFKTPIGTYAYVQIPKRVFYLGVNRIESEKSIFLMASPVKAIADYVFHKHKNWSNAEEFLESLRIEWTDLKINHSEIDPFIKEYRSKRVIKLLEELKRIRNEY